MSAIRHSFGEKERVQCAVSAQHANERIVSRSTSSSSCGGVAKLVRDTCPSIVERDDEEFLVGQRRLVAISSIF